MKVEEGPRWVVGGEGSVLVPSPVGSSHHNRRDRLKQSRAPIALSEAVADRFLPSTVREPGHQELRTGIAFLSIVGFSSPWLWMGCTIPSSRLSKIAFKGLSRVVAQGAKGLYFGWPK